MQTFIMVGHTFPPQHSTKRHQPGIRHTADKPGQHSPIEFSGPEGIY